MQALSQLRNATACRLKTSLQSVKTCGRPKHIPEGNTQVACSQQTQKDPKASYYFPTLTTSQAREDTTVIIAAIQSVKLLD